MDPHLHPPMRDMQAHSRNQGPRRESSGTSGRSGLGKSIQVSNINQEFTKYQLEGVSNLYQDYQILRPLGKGAHSKVYEAKDSFTGGHFAVKMVNKELLKKEKMTERMINEIKIHKALKHKNILDLKTVFEDDQKVYIVLELCKRGELYGYVKSRQRLSEQEAVKYFSEIVEGVSYLHSLGVMHRDLKLGNVLFGDDGHIKIADFGLAVQLRSDQEERQTLCGTPNYISPQVINRKPYGLEADIWSLGCLLYALLVGKPPFECATVQDTLQRVSNKDYQLHPFLSVEAQDLLIKLLQESPEHRMSPDEILEHPLFHKQQEQPVYILKDILSPEQSPEPQELKETVPRGFLHHQKLEYEGVARYKKASQFRSAEKASSGFNRIESKTAIQIDPTPRNNIFKTTQKLQHQNLSDSLGTNNQGSSNQRTPSVTPFATDDLDQQEEEVERKQLPRPTSPLPNVPMMRKQRHNSKPFIQNYLHEDDTFGPPPRQPQRLSDLNRRKGMSSKTPVKNDLTDPSSEEHSALKPVTDFYKRKSFLKKKSLQDAFKDSRISARRAGSFAEKTQQHSSFDIGHRQQPIQSTEPDDDSKPVYRSYAQALKNLNISADSGYAHRSNQKGGSSSITPKARAISSRQGVLAFGKLPGKPVRVPSSSPLGRRSVSPNSVKWPVKALSTLRLNPITHDSDKGRVCITRDGWVRIEIQKKNKMLSISPDGVIIQVSSMTEPDHKQKYGLSVLPSSFRPLYVYASQFVEVIRKKTPKVVYEGVAEGLEVKAYLMENEPFHNFQLHTSKGLKFVYQIGSERIRIRDEYGSQIVVNPYNEKDEMYKRFGKHIELLYEYLRICLEAENKGSQQYPIRLSADTGGTRL